MPGILDDEFLRKIDKLSLVSKRVRVGNTKGERRSPKRGTSVEFADYRNYTPGDDLRQVDWNIYARLERVFVKLFEEEEELNVHLLLDCSRSMDWSGPDEESVKDETYKTNPQHNKLLYGKKTVAALAYMALSAMDRITITGIGGRGGPGELNLPFLRGKNQTVRMIRFMEDLKAGEGDELNHSLRNYANRARYSGLLFLVSDLFVPGGCFEGLRFLQNAGFEVILIHLLAPDEVNPVLRGDFKLVDSETGIAREVTIDNTALELYRREFANWQGEIVRFCQKRGINYVQVDTAYPFDELVLQYMRRRGILV